MKSFLLLFTCLCTFAISLNGQWVVQTSGATGNLQSVSAVNNNVCWIGGATGQVLRTTNGGSTWTNVGGGSVIGTTNDVTYIYAFNADTALCTTSSTTPVTYVYKTTNGGSTWTQVFTQTSGFIDAFDFTTPSNGFMIGDPVGARWSMWKTTDGGSTWDSTGLRLAQAASEAGWNNSLFMRGDEIWFGTNSTKIYYSSNQGATWSAQATTGQANSYCVYFVGAVGFTGGASTVAKTTNNGTAWSLATLPGSGSSFGCTATASTWYVSRTGSIYASTDNGSTWTTANTSSNTIYAIGKARNGSAIWACGASGSIVKSPVPAVAVTAPGNGAVWSVGTTKNITWTSSSIANVTIKYSTDAGSTWLPVAASVAAASGTYSWIVPNTPSTQCKIRVSDASADTVYALSSGTFSISTATVIPMALASGWNMVSVGVVAPDMTAATLFSGSNSSVFGYNNGYVTTSTLANGMGYWVRYAAPATFSISGAPVSGNTISLASGWNMVGPYMWDAAVSGITTTPSGIINSSFFGFNNGYTQATVLEKGKGYWVRATQAGTMTLPSGTGKSYNPVSVIPSKTMGKIIITDAEGKSATLYATGTGDEAINRNSSDLPPVPPGEVFDVRFASNRNTESLAGGGQSITIQGGSYPLTLRAEGNALNLIDNATGGRLLNTVLKDGEQVQINNAQVHAITVSALSTVNRYELAQNYPNPFNPATTISFSLREKQHVTVKIFDMLGNEVAMLVNEEKPAGTYFIPFDGSALSSGVYFYQLKAGSYSDTKKLTLLK